MEADNSRSLQKLGRILLSWASASFLALLRDPRLFQTVFVCGVEQEIVLVAGLVASAAPARTVTM